MFQGEKQEKEKTGNSFMPRCIQGERYESGDWAVRMTEKQWVKSVRCGQEENEVGVGGWP